MVCSGVLSGCLLLSLLSSGIWASNVENLSKIIKYVNDNYRTGGQYAVAINVSPEQCTSNFSPDSTNFLQEDPPTTVRNGINTENKIYIGNQLIAAKPRISQRYNIHSEYTLLNPPNPLESPMKNLLKKNQNGCVVFFTYNSPCVRTCLNPNGQYNILKALDMIKNHNGPKAFVFNKVWHHDENKQNLASHLREIDNRVPLYRCDNTCVSCRSNGNNIDKKCLSE